MKKSLWIIVILSLFTATFFNQLNINQLPEEFIRDGETIITNDDGSYLGPATNFYENGIWKNNFSGKISYFAHTPGYGILYYFCLNLHPQNPLLLLKIFQIICFTLSVYCFFHISYFLLKNEVISLIITAVYGLSPFFIGFLFYTLTEGITPALLIFYVYFLLKGYVAISIRQKNILIGLAALIFSFLFIARPVLVIFALFLPIVIILTYKSWFKKLILFGVMASSFMIIWQVRNYNLANKYVGIYPIYYQDNNSIYRPTLESFWDFNKSWGVEGHIYHSYSFPFWQAAIKGDTSITHIKNILNHFPKYVTNFYGEKRLIEQFRNYQKSILIQKTFFDKKLPMPDYEIPEEQLVVKEFNQLTSEFKKKYWLQYYVISPLKTFKVMAFHSNLSLYIFQVTYRGNYIMEFFRLLFFSLHSLSFIALIFNLFLINKNNLVKNSIFIFSFIYIFFLCYYQRGIEERYTLPILPFLLIAFFNIILQLNHFVSQKLLFKKSTNTP